MRSAPAASRPAIASRCFSPNRSRPSSAISPPTSSAPSPCRWRRSSASMRSATGLPLPARRRSSPTPPAWRSSPRSARDLPDLATILCTDGAAGDAEGLRDAVMPENGEPFDVGRHARRRSGADDLHLRHHRPAQGRAPRPSRAARPSARLRLHPRLSAAAGRPHLDAVRLGVGGRTAQRAPPRPVLRRAGRLRALPAVRSRRPPSP